MAKQRRDEARIRERMRAMVAFDQAATPGFYYLSFVDPGRPEGSRFLGATVVEAGGPTALIAAGALDINPGGEVAIWKIEDDGTNAGNLAFLKNRQLCRLRTTAI